MPTANKMIIKAHRGNEPTETIPSEASKIHACPDHGHWPGKEGDVRESSAKTYLLNSVSQPSMVKTKYQIVQGLRLAPTPLPERSSHTNPWTNPS